MVTVLALLWWDLPAVYGNHTGCSAYSECTPPRYDHWEIAREWYLVADPSSPRMWFYWGSAAALVVLSAWGWKVLFRCRSALTSVVGRCAAFAGIQFAVLIGVLTVGGTIANYGVFDIQEVQCVICGRTLSE